MKKESGMTMGSEANETRFARWEKTRKRGPVHYIIVYGFLG